MSRSRSPTARFQACCVTHAESFLVTPRTSTRLQRPSSMVKSTYSVRSQPSHREEVKGQDRVSLRAEEPLHEGPIRRGAGPRWCRRRTVRIAVAETVMPSFSSSPRILR